MLLNDLVKAGIVELNKLGKIVDVGNNITEVLFEQHKLLLSWAVLAESTLVQAAHDFFYFALAHSNATGNFHRLYLLLCVNLLELGLELADEARLIILRPFWALACGLDRAGGPFEFVLQTIVIDIVPLVLVDNAGAKLLSEFHDYDTGPDDMMLAVAGAMPSSGTGFEVLNNQHVRIEEAGCNTRAIEFELRAWRMKEYKAIMPEAVRSMKSIDRCC